MKCIAHKLGLDHECRNPGECNGNNNDSDQLSINVDPGGDIEEEDTEGRQTYKDDSTLIDQQSTGRKRAARWYPIDENKVCEWAGKKNCGGGKIPITGCVANLQQARHHGPDKNTLNNDKNNVHRICHSCHNRWHTLNDPVYVRSEIPEPHNPTIATAEDIVENEKFWEGRKIVKAKD